MCLSKVHEKITHKGGVGFKVFAKFSNGLRGLYHSNEFFSERKWYKDSKKGMIRTEIWNKYKTGFHIFLCKEDAQIYCSPIEVVHKVSFTGVVAEGMQDFNWYSEPGRVVVARRMYIQEQVYPAPK